MPIRGWPQHHRQRCSGAPRSLAARNTWSSARRNWSAAPAPNCPAAPNQHRETIPRHRAAPRPPNQTPLAQSPHGQLQPRPLRPAPTRRWCALHPAWHQHVTVAAHRRQTMKIRHHHAPACANALTTFRYQRESNAPCGYRHAQSTGETRLHDCPTRPRPPRHAHQSTPLASHLQQSVRTLPRPRGPRRAPQCGVMLVWPPSKTLGGSGCQASIRPRLALGAPLGSMPGSMPGSTPGSMPERMRTGKYLTLMPLPRQRRTQAEGLQLGHCNLA